MSNTTSEARTEVTAQVAAAMAGRDGYELLAALQQAQNAWREAMLIAKRIQIVLPLAADEDDAREFLAARAAELEQELQEGLSGYGFEAPIQTACNLTELFGEHEAGAADLPGLEELRGVWGCCDDTGETQR